MQYKKRIALDSLRCASAACVGGVTCQLSTDNMKRKKQKISGSCLCGLIEYEVQEPFLRVVHCHCTRCQKASGSSHLTNIYVFPENLFWISGKEKLVRFDLPSARSFSTTFCSQCGSPLPHHTRSGREIIIPAGSLDSNLNIGVAEHSFWEARPSWSCAHQ